jgi:hypothetical protein
VEKVCSNKIASGGFAANIFVKIMPSGCATKMADGR